MSTHSRRTLLSFQEDVLQLALIGVGRVGGLVVDALVARDRMLGGRLVTGAIVVDTALEDLDSLRFVPPTHRIPIGAAYPSRAGIDGDNELGASIAAEDIEQILAGVDCLPSHRADAFLVVSALGGGTGGGGAPVVARHLSRLFAQPVYGVGILPADDVDDPVAHAAVRSLVTFVREVDNLVLTETPRGHTVDGVSTLARRLTAVFDDVLPPGNPRWAAGRRDEAVLLGTTEVVVDSDDTAEALVVATGSPVTLPSVLAAGRVSVLCGTTRPTGSGVLGRLWPGRGTTDEDTAVVHAVRDAAVGRQPGQSPRWDTEQVEPTPVLPARADPPSAAQAWLVVNGPRRVLSPQAVDDARQWLHEETCARVVGGHVEATAGTTLTSTLLLSGVQRHPQVDRLWAQALEARPRPPTRDWSLPATLDARTEGFEPLF